MILDMNNLSFVKIKMFSSKIIKRKNDCGINADMLKRWDL